MNGPLLRLLWPVVTLRTTPGAQRPVERVQYLLDGRVVGEASASDAPVRVHLVPLLLLSAGKKVMTARVDDGLVGESPPTQPGAQVDYVPLAPVLALLAAGGYAGVRVRGARRRDDDLGDQTAVPNATAPTPFFLKSVAPGASDADRVIRLRSHGTLGRGMGEYALDHENGFYGAVSRTHAILEVREDMVVVAPCAHAAQPGGVTHVELLPPDGPARVLESLDPVPVEVNSRIVLGSHPARGHSERPTFELDVIPMTLLRTQSQGGRGPAPSGRPREDAEAGLDPVSAADSAGGH
jgi:hypothetical protein